MKKYLIVMFVLGCINSHAQLFRMSATSYVSELSSSSSFIQYAGVNCVTIQTGLYSGTVGKFNLFVIDCEFNYKRIRIKFYPNPVINNAKLQLINTDLNDKYQINIYDILGLKISTINEYGYNLNNGVLLNLNDLPTNTYILEVSSKSFRDVIKFVKEK